MRDWETGHDTRILCRQSTMRPVRNPEVSGHRISIRGNRGCTHRYSAELGVPDVLPAIRKQRDSPRNFRIADNTDSMGYRVYLSRIGTPSRLREIATTTKPTKLTGRTTNPIAQSKRKLNAMGPPSPLKLPPEMPKRIRLNTHVKKERQVIPTNDSD